MLKSLKFYFTPLHKILLTCSWNQIIVFKMMFSKIRTKDNKKRFLDLLRILKSKYDSKNIVGNIGNMPNANWFIWSKQPSKYRAR